jgi:hypothetical protein
MTGRATTPAATATERLSDCIVSLAADSKSVGLSFYHGATLPDPAGILMGSGNQNPFVRSESTATLDDPAVAAKQRPRRDSRQPAGPRGRAR